MSEQIHAEVLRPHDLAMLLLASGDLRPRQRARDQQADRAGLDLQRRLLERIMALDPEPEALETTLARIIDETGSPTGPVRALLIAFYEEWRAACSSPALVEHLLTRAREETEGKHRGRRVHP